MVFEEHLIFVPSRYPIGDWHPVGLQCEDVAFATQDGVRLHGWYCPVPRPRCVFLMAHGNAGNITHRVDRIMAWQQSLNASVFVFDYRGYGRSAGRPNDFSPGANQKAIWVVVRSSGSSARNWRSLLDEVFPVPSAREPASVGL